MSNLVNGKTSFRDLYALAEAVSKLLQDDTLLGVFHAMLEKQGFTMTGYESDDTAIIDFAVSRDHSNFTNTFGQSYTDLGFRKQENGEIDVICEHPERVKEALVAAYTEAIIRPIAEEQSLYSRVEQLEEETVITLYR